MNQIDILKEVLKKYNFYNPVPLKIQKKIFRARKRVLKNIFKAEKDYGLLIYPGVFHNSMMKKPGTEHTMTKISRMMKLTGAMVACIVAVVIIYTIQHQYIPGEKSIPLVQKEGRVIFTIGKVEIHNEGETPKIARIKDMVYENTYIKTGKNSKIAIQFNDIGIIQILPESATLIESIKSGNLTKVSIDKGSVYSKIIKSENYKYRIKTPTTVVAVRGTEFLTTYDKKISTIEMLKGKVMVYTLKAPDNKIPLKEKEIIKINKNLDTRIYILKKQRELELEKLGLLRYIENLKEKSESEINEYIEKRKEMEKEIDERINKYNLKLKRLQEEWNKLTPLQKLKKMGKSPFMFHMKDKTKIAGSIVTQDEKIITVDTGQGKVRIPKNEIIRRVPLK